jgi:hypothetical protein
MKFFISAILMMVLCMQAEAQTIEAWNACVEAKAQVHDRYAELMTSYSAYYKSIKEDYNKLCEFGQLKVIPSSKKYVADQESAKQTICWTDTSADTLRTSLESHARWVREVADWCRRAAATK